MVYQSLFGLKKLLKKSTMKQFRVAIGAAGASSCFLTFLLYYWHRNSITGIHTLASLKKGAATRTIVSGDTVIAASMRHTALNELYDDNFNDTTTYDIFAMERRRVRMIETPGCEIPLQMIDYNKYMKKLKNPPTCGKRVVFLKKVESNQARVTIKANIMKKYLRKSARFDCCYRFIHRSAQPGQGNKKTQFTSCKKIKDGEIIKLQNDFVNVKCSEYDRRNVSRVVYDDVYAFIKKINVSITNRAACDRDKYNVLMIGMDSMSLPRFVKTMKRSVIFLKDNFWLGFRGYHKIGDNTLPNLMAAFMGQNMSKVTEKCSGKMDECNDDLIWSKFKKKDYATAYGEDYLRLPDTFYGDFDFKQPPTDHYLRPLFINRETESHNKALVCAGKVPSAQHILDYAVDFAHTYRNDSFFGVFWMNSYSHNNNSRPQDADNMLESFLNRLTYIDVLDNTFVVLFSDHGIRFGEHRQTFESYYDERMPYLFMYVPKTFKARHRLKYKNLTINQFRLSTPYDLYNTLVDINGMPNCEELSNGVAAACPECHSLFRAISGNRSCADVDISEKWCSCHNLYPLDTEDRDGVHSVGAVVSYITSRTNTIKTKQCWKCKSLSLKKIIRIHYYYDKTRTHLYHVVAFIMKPGNVAYEATVSRKGSEAKIVGSVSVISPYKGFGGCTVTRKDRVFCVCDKPANCHKN